MQSMAVLATKTLYLHSIEHGHFQTLNTPSFAEVTMVGLNPKEKLWKKCKIRSYFDLEASGALL